jgi:hypothetical protein
LQCTITFSPASLRVPRAQSIRPEVSGCSALLEEQARYLPCTVDESKGFAHLFRQLCRRRWGISKRHLAVVIASVFENLRTINTTHDELAVDLGEVFMRGFGRVTRITKV